MNYYTQILKQSPQEAKTVTTVALIVAVMFATLPMKVVHADEFPTSTGDYVSDITARGDGSAHVFTFPKYTKATVVRSYASVPMTAYTSRPEETDSTPFTTADGSTVRDGIVACNFLPFGTKVRIPELFGDKIFEVHDRMNKRYPYKMDFWMEDLGDARQFGVRRAHIEVVTTEERN